MRLLSHTELEGKDTFLDCNTKAKDTFLRLSRKADDTLPGCVREKRAEDTLSHCAGG